MQSFHTESDDTPQPEKEIESFYVCPIAALPSGACLRLTLPNGDELAIYNVNGEYYATDNFCPHRGAPLSEGAMFGHVVECGLHGWQFDVRNGECLTVRERIKTFAVKTRDGMVFVDLQQSL
jgi:naphthalene 1,2-dioxygenase ferredoxin component